VNPLTPPAGEHLLTKSTSIDVGSLRLMIICELKVYEALVADRYGQRHLHSLFWSLTYYCLIHTWLVDYAMMQTLVSMQRSRGGVLFKKSRYCTLK